MKHTISIIILLLTLNSYTQGKKCSDIKNGKFKYFDSTSNEIIEIRKDSMQIDSSSNLGLAYYSKIKWTSECAYEMTVYKVNNPEFEFLIGSTFEFEILAIDKDQVRLKTKTVNKERESEYVMQIMD